MLVNQSDDKDIPVTDQTESFGCGRMDVKNNNILELDDFAAFAKSYGDECNLIPLPESYPNCGFKDADEDGIVNLKDFAWFSTLYFEKRCSILPKNSQEDAQTVSGFVLTQKANQSNGSIEYTVTGEKPTPCHFVKITETKSQDIVDINVEILTPSSDVICAQVITPFKETGTITGDVETKLRLKIVTNNNVDDTNNVDTGNKPPVNPNEVGKTISKTDNGATATFTYKGNNTWTYSATGYEPNGCSSSSEEIAVSGNTISYTITITSAQSGDIFCTQVAREYNYTGTISASGSAAIEFKEVTADSPAP